jgi:quercetin dioxygenase-like cupin family protein
MSLQVRRVVTGHDEQGRAIVMIDDISRNLPSARPGFMASTIWTTHSNPVDNSGHDDAGARAVATTLPGGTIFRVVEFMPGVAARVHRTDSVDYHVILSGEIHMELDGSEVHLKSGDVLVQRGTIHNWVNRSDKPCVMALVLVDAKSAVAGGKTLQPVG